jgi:hypothetical protein
VGCTVITGTLGEVMIPELGWMLRPPVLAALLKGEPAGAPCDRGTEPGSEYMDAYCVKAEV